MTNQLSLPFGLPIFETPDNTADGCTCSIRDLWTYPDIPPSLYSTRAKMLGSAGEALCDVVCMTHGMLSIPVPEFCHFDRLVVYGKYPLRIQCKVRHSCINGFYTFQVRRGDPRHPGGVVEYATGDFDILAMVLLAERVVKFTANWTTEQTVALWEIDVLRRAPIASFERALEFLGIPRITDAMPAPIYPAAA